jgi:hypothetical protein
MKWIQRAVYGVFGTLAVGGGAYSVFGPITAAVEERHLLRELGAAGVFIGLMAFWCLANPGRRRGVHLGLMVFAALFAGIHWFDWVQDRRGIASPLLNTVPLAALALIAPRRTGE